MGKTNDRCPLQAECETKCHYVGHELDCPYGTYFTTYAYPPAHIDREAWEPCRVCGQYEVLGFRGWRRKENILKPPDGSGGCMYCPHCGRPRNDKAWDQLEQRLRGEQVDEQERGRSEAGDTGPLLLPQEQGLL